MDSKAPVALAIAIGYLLGRKHKLRWALLLGGAAATGQLGGLSTRVLQRGGQLLRSNPELATFTDSVTKLLDAGRGAAISAMNEKVEALEQRARLSEVPAKGRETLRGRRHDDEESDVYDGDAEYDDEVRRRDMDDEDEDRGRYLDDDEGDEGDEDEPEDEESEDEEFEDEASEDEGAARGRSGGRQVRSGQGGGGRREPAVRRTRREGR